MSNLGADPKWCYLCGRPMAECAHRTYSPPPIQIPGPDDECPSCATLRAALAEAEKKLALSRDEVESLVDISDKAEARAEAAEKDAENLADAIRTTIEALERTPRSDPRRGVGEGFCLGFRAILAAHEAAKGRR